VLAGTRHGILSPACHSIPAAVDRFYERLVGDHGDPSAKAAHRDLQQMNVVLVPGTPDRPQQLVMADQPIRTLGQATQQPEFGRRQVDFDAPHFDCTPGGIDDQRPELDPAFGGFALASWGR
jgi:hypothetical protein